MQVYSSNSAQKLSTSLFNQANQLSKNTNFAEILSSALSNSETKQVNQPQHSDKAAVMDTNQGNQEFNLDAYFATQPSQQHVDMAKMPILIPTAHNIEALSKYSEQKFKQLLQQYDIPAPPSSIEFDGEGELVLPANYPYASELKQALKENPNVEKALSTTSALAGHYASLMEAKPFHDEMATAKNNNDRDRIVAKYSFLFDENRPDKQAVLNFLEDGSMLIGQKQA